MYTIGLVDRTLILPTIYIYAHLFLTGVKLAEIYFKKSDYSRFNFRDKNNWSSDTITKQQRKFESGLLWFVRNIIERCFKSAYSWM